MPLRPDREFSPRGTEGRTNVSDSFERATLGRTGISTYRLGLSASYRPGADAVRWALDHGIDFFFAYGWDRQMVRGLRDALRSDRQRCVLAAGAYNLLLGHFDLRRTLHRRLRQFHTDYIDVFLFLGVMRPKQCPDEVLEQLQRFREEGLVRAIGISGHDRRFAAELIRRGAVDVAMVRYNAAHRGAETEVFPHLTRHGSGLVGYTATCWTRLLRRPRGWNRGWPVPSAADCYRFVLSNPHVDVCLTAPRSLAQLKENVAALSLGPVGGDEMAFMRAFGDEVHSRRRWFM